MALARAAGALSRASRRGGGTSFPGKLLLRMDPRAIARLSRRLDRGAIVVSATNGKTTTAGMIAAILREAQRRRRCTTAPGRTCRAVWPPRSSSRPAATAKPAIGLFEVDEAWLPSVVEDVSPHTVLLGNLFRDQLDRYGELEKLADEWSALVAEPRRAHVVRAERRRPAGGRPRAGPRRRAARAA